MQEFCMQIFAHARDSILQLHAGQLVNAWKHDHRCGDVLLGVSSFRVRIFIYIYYKCLQTAVFVQSFAKAQRAAVLKGLIVAGPLQQLGANAEN